MRGAVLLAIALLAAVTAGGAPAAPSAARGGAPTTTSPLEALESELLARVNGVRTRSGLRPLRLSRPLAAAADAHSRTLARRGLFVHSVPGGPPFYKRVRRFYGAAGFRRWTVGENLLAMSPTLTASEAMQMWLGSPGHRRNLLRPEWRDVGFGAIYAENAPGIWGGESVTIVTAEFGFRR